MPHRYIGIISDMKRTTIHSWLQC